MKDVKIVVGSCFGDEGKGLVTNAFCRKMMTETKETPIVIFHNGTAQRGHTVDYADNIRHVFHHFGSGTLSGGRTFFSQSFLVHPMEYVREYKELCEFGYYGYPEKTYCSPYCRVITPFDMMVDRATEEWITITTGNPEHASCALGSWCAVEDRLPKMRTDFHIWNFCSCEEEEYDMMMRAIWADCVEILNNRGVDLMCTSYKNYAKKAYRDSVAKRFYEDIKFFSSRNIFIPFNELWEQYNNFIFEGGQGLGLDMNNGEWHTTSKTGLDNPVGMLLHKKDFAAEVCYVTRAYETRHGLGRMNDEIQKEKINATVHDRTNVFNEYQGSFRYGYLNNKDMFARIDKDWTKVNGDNRFSKALVVTHCNEFPEGIIESKYFSDNPFRMEERK